MAVSYTHLDVYKRQILYDKHLKRNSTTPYGGQTVPMKTNRKQSWRFPTTRQYDTYQTSREFYQGTGVHNTTENDSIRHEAGSTAHYFHNVETTKRTADNPNRNTIKLSVVHKKTKKNHKKKHNKINLKPNLNYHIFIDQKNTRRYDNTYVPHDITTGSPFYTDDKLNMVHVTSDFPTFANTGTVTTLSTTIQRRTNMKKKHSKNKSAFEKSKMKHKKYMTLTTIPTTVKENDSRISSTEMRETKCVEVVTTETTTKTTLSENDLCTQESSVSVSTSANPLTLSVSHSRDPRRKQSLRTTPYKIHVTRKVKTKPPRILAPKTYHHVRITTCLLYTSRCV